MDLAVRNGVLFWYFNYCEYFQVVSDDLIKKLCSVMIESGRRYTAKVPRIPLMYAYYKTEYLGEYS